MNTLVVKNELRTLIKEYNDVILSGHNKLVKDYYMYFEQVGEDMFKATYTKDFLEQILKIEEENFETECKRILEFWVEQFTRELLIYNFSRHSSHSLKNITRIWELESKQYMIRLFKDYLK